MVLVIQLTYFFIPVDRGLILGNTDGGGIFHIFFHVVQQGLNGPTSQSYNALIGHLHLELLRVLHNDYDVFITLLVRNLQTFLFLFTVLDALF